jgi:hypothetical protein
VHANAVAHGFGLAVLDAVADAVRAQEEVRLFALTFALVMNAVLAAVEAVVSLLPVWVEVASWVLLVQVAPMPISCFKVMFNSRDD